LTSAGRSEALTVAAAADKPVPIPKKELKALLQVNDGLTDTNNKSLRYAYSKYKATITAVQLYNQIILKGRWPGHYQKVTVTEVQQIFVSKSAWHGQYVPCFHDITNHGEMVEWLEDSGSENDAEDVWGFKKTVYHFLDLKDWLEQKEKNEEEGDKENRGERFKDEESTGQGSKEKEVSNSSLLVYLSL